MDARTGNKLARAKLGKVQCLLGIERKVALVKHASLLYETDYRPKHEI